MIAHVVLTSSLKSDLYPHAHRFRLDIQITQHIVIMNQKTYEWAVIGAGPAGIAAIGKLLDESITPSNILWIDPYFNVGDLGRYWQNVSSNTSVALFIKFLSAIKSFSFHKAPHDFNLSHFPLENTCTLHYVVEPLQWITHHLATIIHQEQTVIHELKLANRQWSLISDTQSFKAKHVILATGAIPESLNYPEVETVSFEVAIDKDKLKQQMQPSDAYAVFGSSHSAIMILQYLVELGAKKIINFYRTPCRYALPMDDWILFDNTGLKGQTAQWAKQYIDGVLPKQLERHVTNDKNTTRFLTECNKAIYAVGFKRRNNIVINNFEQLHYNPHVGILAPGLFGFGIGYPELHIDPLGNQEYQVGLWKFLIYLNKVMPIWLRYST